MGVVTGKKADGTDAYQTVNTTFINESGVYSLIFGSKQERAKEFKRWVTSEVLPSIRKTGQYSIAQPSLNDKLQANLTFADWTIKTLNLNEASKLSLAKKISDKFGLAAEIPAYGTPRLANRLLKRVRDFAEVKYDGNITLSVANFADRKSVV